MAFCELTDMCPIDAIDTYLLIFIVFDIFKSYDLARLFHWTTMVLRHLPMITTEEPVMFTLSVLQASQRYVVLDITWLVGHII